MMKKLWCPVAKVVLVASALALLMGCPKKPGTSDRRKEKTRAWLQSRLEEIFPKELSWVEGLGDDGLPFRFKYAGGILAIGVKVEKSVRRIQVSFSGISLKKLTKDTGGALLDGTLAGSANLRAGAGVSNLHGKIVLKCIKCTAGGVKVGLKIPKAYASQWPKQLIIPKLRFGELGCTIKIGKGRARFQSCEGRSGDLKLRLTGTVTLKDPFRFSVINASIKFKFSDALKKRDSRWATIEEILAQARDQNNYLVFTLRGRLSSVRLRP